MKLLVKSRYLLYMLVLAVSMVSCNDSDDNGDNGGGGNGGGTSPLTPDQHKAKLETIGKDFVAKFNPNDHKVAAEALECLNEIIDAPGLFDGDDEVAVPTPPFQEIAATVFSVARNNNMNGLAALAAMDADEYRLSEYAGVYTYNATKKEWEKTDASNKIELKYDLNGKTCDLLLTFEGGSDYDKAEDVIVEVPEKVNFSMKVADAEQISASVVTKLTDGQKSADVAVKVSLIGGYKWELSVSAKSNIVTETYSMSKNSEVLMASVAKLTGNKLTDPDEIENGEAGDLLADGEFDFRVMDVALKGKGDIKAIIDAVDKIPDALTEKEKAQMEADAYNKYANISMSYYGDAEKVADIKMDIYFDGTGNRYNPETGKTEKVDYYYVSPCLIFASDGSKFEMETYFSEANFGSLIKSVETLVNKYADLIGEDHVEL